MADGIHEKSSDDEELADVSQDGMNPIIKNRCIFSFPSKQNNLVIQLRRLFHVCTR